ncbi:MAG: PTS sugar transporter subunit IIA [Bacilli bacterium]
MLGLILCGHGNFASGLASSAKLLAGNVSDLDYVDFLEGMGQDSLKEKLEEKIRLLDNCEKIAILSDIVGGTPFKTSVLISLVSPNVFVVSGTNLPLLLQLILAREGITDNELFINDSIKEAKEALFLFDVKNYE